MPSTWSQILDHLVFSTKDREMLVSPELRQRLYPFVGGIVRDQGGTMLAIGGMPDHVHLLVRWKTEPGIAVLVRDVKARSSAWVHREWPLLKGFAWQVGGGVFTVSQSLAPTLENYILKQEEHHRSRSSMEEFKALLKKHRIDYDERYL